MGSFQSIGMAQTPTLCQFCEDSPDIKWKCINCELFFCQLCNSKIHRKIKGSSEHEVINTKDFGIEDLATSMRKVDLQNMVCTKHSKQKCFAYCNECRVPACSKCLMEPHKGRDYIPLDEMYKNIVSEMRELITKFEENLQFFRNEKDKLQKILSDGEINFHETRETILQTEKEMREAISKSTKDILQELDAKWKPSENRIQTELSELKRNEDELETRMNNLHQALQSHDAADIFSTDKTLEKSLLKYNVNKINQCRTNFIPRNIKVKNGRHSMIGDLYIYRVPEMGLRDTYQSNLVNVTKILVFDDNTAFIGSRTDEKIQKVKFEHNEIKVEEEIYIKVYDMSLTQDGEILVSSGESDIQNTSKDKQLKIFMECSPLNITCVHVTKDNRIIVGLVESFYAELSPSKDCIRRLVVVNQDGDIQHTIEHDKDNQRLLTHPRRIKTFNDNIVVVDIINNEWEGKVVMLDYGGQLHWTYNGCNSIKSDQVKFYLRDVSITSTDMILVADWKNHAIHVLNHAGQVIVYKDVKCLGIEFPLSLDIDNSDVLWIGCHTWAKFDTKKAKIHCVKLT
ncbi:Hypothetical predicted protein [Mytilus galloprovincialis]|uniref:B box-type domain-containing protein n=1 Tax=Mytilus galloprovincialis TaxID=29158 RepID=A0A8B6CLE2_MYTGA|nr:Hypothetical predicted protein [Mytilus galloprovincialis]